MSEFATVCNVDEIPAGQGSSFDVGDRCIAVFNYGGGKFTAIDDLCPHMGASLVEGHFDTETCNVACPWHGWRFNVKNGQWTDNPRVATDVFSGRVVGQEVQVATQPTKPTNDEPSR